MHKVVISDTSCFIILSNINELDLLKQVYGKVFTTPEVVLEFGDKLPEWVEPLTAKDTHKQKLLEMQVDLGEASAIALAMEFDSSGLI
jgi:predicted nucleic acid-binding protein